jgi:hypothetical protein
VTASAIGILILALLGFWFLGGLLLRVGGVLLVLVGAMGLAVTGDASAVIPLTAGTCLWLAGRFHRAVRRRA